MPLNHETAAHDMAAAALALAQRFADGATMWCASPEWPWHARHVAVEFVHPVIVGKRALPAVAIEGGDLAALRQLVRPGDVLLTIASAGEEVTGDLLCRAPAWGLTRIAVGAGRRPKAGQAEHLLWVDGADVSVAASSGALMLCYHLLWELTHVVFEHPGLLTPEPDGADEVCITCRDEAQVGEVRAVGDDGQLEATVAGQCRMVDGSLLEAVAPGDLLLVHAGVALCHLVPDAGGELR